MRLTLRELRQLVQEKVRSRSGAFAPGMPSRFDLKQLDRFEGGPQQVQYAKHFLEELGRGSSRAAFLLTSHRVLKVALNEKGIAQNEAELAVFTNPKTKAITSKIFDYDPKHRWLVSELVRPLKSDEEFIKLTGDNWYTFINSVGLIKKGRAGDVDPDASDLIWAAGNTVRANELQMGDIDEIGHWGKTPDGRVVLLDYGFTGEVWEKHYSQDDVPTPDAATRKA